MDDVKVGEYIFSPGSGQWHDGFKFVLSSVVFDGDVVWLGIYTNEARARAALALRDKPWAKAAYYNSDLGGILWLEWPFDPSLIEISDVPGRLGQRGRLVAMLKTILLKYIGTAHDLEYFSRGVCRHNAPDDEEAVVAARTLIAECEERVESAGPCTVAAAIDHADGAWAWSLKINGAGMKWSAHGRVESWGFAAAAVHTALSDAAVCHSGMISDIHDEESKQELLRGNLLSAARRMQAAFAPHLHMDHIGDQLELQAEARAGLDAAIAECKEAGDC